MKIKEGQKVRFRYEDEETQKEVQGIGKVTEIEESGIIHVKTTRKSHWMEYDEELQNVRPI